MTDEQIVRFDDEGFKLLKAFMDRGFIVGIEGDIYTDTSRYYFGNRSYSSVGRALVL